MPSTYPLLNGNYVFFIYRSWNNYLYEVSQYRSYIFDGTAKALYYSSDWSYTASRGWRNPSRKGRLFYYEWKIVNGAFYERLWGNPYDSWDSYDFELIDANNFKLDGKLYTKK